MRNVLLAAATLVWVLPLLCVVSLDAGHRRYPSLSEFLERYKVPAPTGTPGDSASQVSIISMCDELNHVLVELKDFLTTHSLPGSICSIKYTCASDAYDIQIDLDGTVDLTNWDHTTHGYTTGLKNLRNLRLARVNPVNYSGAVVLPEIWPPASEGTAMRHEQKFQLILPMDPPGVLQAKRID